MLAPVQQRDPYEQISPKMLVWVHQLDLYGQRFYNHTIQVSRLAAQVPREKSHLRQKRHPPAPKRGGTCIGDCANRSDWKNHLGTGLAIVRRKGYLCKVESLIESMLQKEFVISAVVHGGVFVLFMLVGNWIWHWGMNWFSFLVAGVIYGVVSAGMDRLLEKYKKE